MKSLICPTCRRSPYFWGFSLIGFLEVARGGSLWLALLAMPVGMILAHRLSPTRKRVEEPKEET